MSTNVKCIADAGYFINVYGSDTHNIPQELFILVLFSLELIIFLFYNNRNDTLGNTRIEDYYHDVVTLHVRYCIFFSSLFHYLCSVSCKISQHLVFCLLLIEVKLRSESLFYTDFTAGIS